MRRSRRQSGKTFLSPSPGTAPTERGRETERGGTSITGQREASPDTSKVEQRTGILLSAQGSTRRDGSCWRAVCVVREWLEVVAMI
jgi:hypothetical protein